MKNRQAAKNVISCPEGIVLVAGQRGVWNLPGGGFRPGETAIQALLREQNEELKALNDLTTTAVQLGEVSGQTSHADGSRRWTTWGVFGAQLLVPASELAIAAGSEITAVTAKPPEACLLDSNISDLARQAIMLAVALDLADYQQAA